MLLSTPKFSHNRALTSLIRIEEAENTRRHYESARTNRSSSRKHVPHVSTIISNSRVSTVPNTIHRSLSSHRHTKTQAASPTKPSTNHSSASPKLTTNSFRTTSRAIMQPHLIPTPVTKYSSKSYGKMIESYAVSTHHGLYHVNNQDKISIHLSRLCMFGIFDGYSGSGASQFLKNQMIAEMMMSHQNIDMQRLLLESFQMTEQRLLTEQRNKGDSSGSSALVCLITKSHIYVANCGTSVSVALNSRGELINMNRPHNCQNVDEYARIMTAGGNMYQTRVTVKSKQQHFTEGPLRVHPFGTTLTRCLGNPNIKNPQLYPSSHHLIIAKPQIKYVQTKQIKWIALMSEGLATVLGDTDVKSMVEKCQKIKISHGDDSNIESGMHGVAKRSCEELMKLALSRGCENNASLIIIFLQNTIEKQEVEEPVKPMVKKGSLKYIGSSRGVVEETV